MQSGTVYRQPQLVPLTAVTGCSLWPTPRMRDWKAEGFQAGLRRAETGTLTLPTAVRMWPTPQVQDLKHSPQNAQASLRSGRQIQLTHAVGLWPTPTVSMMDVYSTKTTNHDTWVRLRQRGINGQLNPVFVEWLMGFPLGWTDLDASETPSCPKSQSGLGEGL